MRVLGRWLLRAGLALLVMVLLLLAPVGYVELACQGEGPARPGQALLPPEHHRPETRTLMTYPEWHIVYAYQDYAKVIETGAPHDYGYITSITGYWSSLCHLTRKSATLGAVDGPTRQMVYVIGVSFTAELLAKAVYEETVGRVFVALRGDQRSALDELSAGQAKDYGQFLQQVPWYKWDFRSDAAALQAKATPSWRDTERRTALGLEYRAKAAYADVIAQAVASTGADQLTLRMHVRGASPDSFAAYDGVEVVAIHPTTLELETPRYRALTHLIAQMAADGVEFVEIAGNDDILITLLSDQSDVAGALFSVDRQGFGDTRHALLIKVADLGARLRDLRQSGLRLEHIHDY